MTKDVDLSDFKLVDGVHERGPSFAASQLFNGCGRMFALTATYLPARPKCRTVRVARAHSNGSPQRQSTRTMRGRLLRMTAAPDIPNTRVAYVVPDLKVDCLLLPVADAAHCTHLATMGQ